MAPRPSWLWRHLGAGKAGRGRDTLEPVDRPRRCWEVGGGAAARVREVQGTPEARPEIPAALTKGPGPRYNLWWGFCLCGCLGCVSYSTVYPLSESEVFPRSRYLPLALSASSVPQGASLRCPCLLLCLRKESQRRAPLLAGCQPFATPNQLCLVWLGVERDGGCVSRALARSSWVWVASD